MRRLATWRLVVVMSVGIVACCVIWSAAVQALVPDACSYQPPPVNAQILHCP